MKRSRRSEKIRVGKSGKFKYCAGVIWWWLLDWVRKGKILRNTKTKQKRQRQKTKDKRQKTIDKIPKTKKTEATEGKIGVLCRRQLLATGRCQPPLDPLASLHPETSSALQSHPIMHLTRSLGALRALASSRRPFGPAWLRLSCSSGAQNV